MENDNKIGKTFFYYVFRWNLAIDSFVPLTKTQTRLVVFSFFEISHQSGQIILRVFFLKLSSISCLKVWVSQFHFVYNSKNSKIESILLRHPTRFLEIFFVLICVRWIFLLPSPGWFQLYNNGTRMYIKNFD